MKPADYKYLADGMFRMSMMCRRGDLGPEWKNRAVSFWNIGVEIRRMEIEARESRELAKLWGDKL